MGLTKEVRDFFTNRITALLDAKIEKVTYKVDNKKVGKISVERFCEDWSIDPQSIIRYQEIQKQQNELEAEETEISNTIYAAIQKATNNHNNCYWKNAVDNIEIVALSKYKDAVIADLYPDVPPQLEQIQKVKDDVQTVVMLATTETKLVSRLTGVLQKYGGTIPEILEYIPTQDF